MTTAPLTVLKSAQTYVDANLGCLCREIIDCQSGTPVGPLLSALIKQLTPVKSHNTFSLARGMIQDAAVEKVMKEHTT